MVKFQKLKTIGGFIFPSFLNLCEGEGFLSIMKDVLNLKIEKMKITNMFGNNKFECEYGVGEDFIVIEMAKVCGLELIKENEIKNPLYTTTKGIGKNK
jgi:glycerate kinase